MIRILRRVGASIKIIPLIVLIKHLTPLRDYLISVISVGGNIKSMFI